MSLGDIMCKYKHIGTDMAIRPYGMWYLSQNVF